ncbi:hypothetical protein PpBr36_01056 [Pyricularia pennisetigena]|uniref:hypothetical protein n=1 Tax=Pyricularia pennisetigena TaxID=1578925 RepID=UPI001154A892|nr:hypothetical protein PpBr36_01056 [Pyricularia pennisetigena]TLS29783.1 hypothetical protein PpBr36_01056 [Pyricularia pennisetigena]
MASGANGDVHMAGILDLIRFADGEEPEDMIPFPEPPPTNTPPPPYVGSAQTPEGLLATGSTPQSPETEAPATQSGIDLAVQYLLPAEIRSKDALGVKILQRMDTKYVQTVSGEMITGDTLIIIDVPRGHLPNRTCTGSSYPHQYRIRICSSKLRSCGFDLFPRLLDDEKYQAKTFRRFAAKQTRPPDVTYILDLGPSTDEDLQSTQLETLSLSKGLIRWYKVAKVPPYVNVELVAGHDDCCECADTSDGLPSNSSEESPTQGRDDKGSIWHSCTHSPEYRNIEDYCEVRHAANVVRLLRAIAGMPGCRLPLNSAPRVFTMAGLAKLFELNLSHQSSWLRNEILCWFVADRNSQIIEILTEESIIMAYNLKLAKVARATYRLLVSEHALQLESRLPTQRGRHHFSVFGRPLRDINDDAIQTAVEHGGQALSERVLGIVQNLESDNALQWLGMKQWRDLEHAIQAIGNYVDSSMPWKTKVHVESAQKAFADLKLALLKIVRRRLADAVHLNSLSTIERYGENLSYYASPGHTMKFPEIWHSLNDRQKQLTAVFWEHLERRWPFKIDIMPERVSLRLIAQRLNMALSKLSDPTAVTGREIYPRHYSLNLELLVTQLFDSVQFNVCEPLRGQGVVKPENSELQLLTMSSHLLVGLDEDEMRFLPLWADGLNDGSGGVYISIIPPDMSDTAPIQPGPGYVTGHSRATEATNSTVGDLDLDHLDIQSVATMTETNAAGRATCSTVAPSSQVRGSVDLDFQNARYADPAEHQPVSVGVFGLVDTLEEEDESQDEDSDSGSDSTAQNTPTASVADTDTDSRSSDWVMT